MPRPAHQVPATVLRSCMLVVALLVLVACEKPPPEPGQAYARPVKTVVVTSPELSGIRQFPGRVEAVRRVDLAFRVAGRLNELPIKEAEAVGVGQVIAKLDATDYEVELQNAEGNVDETKAALRAAQSDLQRQLNIQKADPGAVSKRAIDKAREARDRARAKVKAMEAAVSDARNRLKRTTLRAPFDGLIARRYVQNFEEVQAKQPVVALADLSQLEIEFGMPEGLVQRLTEAKVTDDTADQEMPVTATFTAAPDRQYRLTYREISARADPATKTFEVTYVMPRPDDVQVLPGMTASVTVDLRKVLGERQVYLIPVTAVISDEGLNPRVWVVDESAMTLAGRPVEVGRMEGSAIAVLAGIQPGERVVVAGTGYLAEGMKVRLLPDREQAEDNIPREYPVPEPASQG